MKLFTAAACAVVAFATAAQAHPYQGPWIGLDAAFEDYGRTEGGAYSLSAGWDQPIAERWIVGAGVRVTLDGVKDDESVRVGANTSVTTVGIEDQWGGHVRVGRVFGEGLLVFAEAGYERFHLKAVRELRAPVCAPPNGCLISLFDGSFDEEMATIGVGAEWAVSDNLMVRAAYAYGEADAFERNRFGLSAGWRF